MVFKSLDPDLVYSTVKASGVPVLEPVHFARPVHLPGGAKDARFAVIRLGADVIPNGRVFFCDHYTPELVWRPEWQDHANGVMDIAEFVIAARDPADTAAVYDRVFGPGLLEPVAGGVSFDAAAATVTVQTPDATADRFGDALPSLPENGSDRTVALVFKTSSIDRTAGALDQGRIPYRPFGDGVLVAAPDAANVALAFRP